MRNDEAGPAKAGPDTASTAAEDTAPRLSDPSVLPTAALAYALRGWPVFPCRERDKMPLFPSPHAPGSPERKSCRGECGRDGHGCLDATTDLERVTRWWARWPYANIGLATGAPGVDVVDIDIKNGAPGLENYVKLRDAGLLRGAFTTVETWSGGWHLYYAGTQQRNGTRAKHGIDFRSKDGYVLAPPSIISGRRYVFMDQRAPNGATVDWAAICAFLDPPKPAPWRAPGPRNGRGGRRNFDGLIDYIEARPPGDRNAPLYWACCKALEDGADDRVLENLVAASVRSGHDATDARRTMESARRKAVRS